MFFGQIPEFCGGLLGRQIALGLGMHFIADLERARDLKKEQHCVEQLRT